MKRLAAVLALSLSTLHCAQSTNGADAMQPATDASPTPSVCRAWTVGNPLEIPTPNAGQWRVYSAITQNNEVLFLVQNESAPFAPVTWSMVHVNHAATMARVDRLGETEGANQHVGSMTYDPTTRRGAVMLDKHLATLDGTGVVGLLHPAPVRSRFALGPFTSVDVNALGVTAVAEQIRAVWGTSLLIWDGDGQGDASAREVDLGLQDAPLQFVRLVLPDHDFMLLGRPQPLMMASPRQLIAQRYTVDGTLRTSNPSVFQSTTGQLQNMEGVVTPHHILALWEESFDTLPVQFGLFTRALGPTGSPLGDVHRLSDLGFYQRGLSAVARGENVLVTAVAGTGPVRPIVAVLREDGVVERAPLEWPIPNGFETETMRVAATPNGAVVFYTESSLTARKVYAVPLGCVP